MQALPNEGAAHLYEAWRKLFLFCTGAAGTSR